MTDIYNTYSKADDESSNKNILIYVLFILYCFELFKPNFYRRYVDDLFLLFENPNQVTPFFNYLNSQHSNIKFTIEKEADNKLTFLDVSIVRSNNKFSTCVYRKPTFTGLGL